MKKLTIVYAHPTAKQKQMKKPTAKALKSALLAIEDKITAPQLAMLRGHYACRLLTMRQIANIGGYRTSDAGNLQYGNLCKRIALELGMLRPADYDWDWTYIIASAIHPDQQNKEWRWELDNTAMKALGSFLQLA